MPDALNLRDYKMTIGLKKRRTQGLKSIEDCFDALTQELEVYIQKNEERLSTAVNNSFVNVRPENISVKTLRK